MHFITWIQYSIMDHYFAALILLPYKALKCVENMKPLWCSFFANSSSCNKEVIVMCLGRETLIMNVQFYQLNMSWEIYRLIHYNMVYDSVKLQIYLPIFFIQTFLYYIFQINHSWVSAKKVKDYFKIFHCEI